MIADIDNADPAATVTARPAARGTAWGWLLLVVIACLGAAGSLTMSQWFRADAREAWEAQAVQTEQFLSGTVLAWLEESYAPLSGVAVLFENSDVVTEDEFLDAVDGLESRATTLFIDTMASLRVVEADLGRQWIVQFSTDLAHTLAPGAVLPGKSTLVDTIEAAAGEPGRIVLGPPLTVDAQARYAPVALAIADAQGQLIILGLVNFDALIAGLFEVTRPQGVKLRIDGRFSTPEGPGPLLHVHGEPAAQPLYSSTTRTISAGADLSLNWDFDSEFEGGPDEELADFVLYSGLGATAFIVLFIGFLLGRNRTISQRVRTATAELEKSLERFSVLFDASPDPYLILDGEHFTNCNQAAVDLLHYRDKSELLAQDNAAISPPRQPDGADSRERAGAMVAIARERGSHRFDWIHRTRDGEELPTEVILTSFELEGRQVLLVVWHDLSDRYQAQQAMREARDIAEEATRAKSDFLANMSHEIRTPMNAIIGLSHLALGTELGRKQRDYLQKIQSASNNLLGIINDILDFSKIEAGKLSMESIDFNLAKVLDDLANVTHIKAADKGLELVTDLEPELPLALEGDPTRLNQVLVNLTNNAIKFTQEGEVAISVRLVQRDEAGLMLRFAVRDTGIGMNEQERAKLFEAFSQADASTTRKFGGTGLGLAISKRLVEMMGGEIGVESAPGQGTTFWFTAHFGIGAEVDTGDWQTLLEELHGRRVLVVDDHPTSRTILARYLEAFGFSASEVSSGAEAIDELEQTEQPYRLVLMDWMMPGMDGIETSRRILHNPAIEQVPDIIMVTSYGRDEVMEEAEAAGISGLLVKPVNPSTLLDAILDATGRAVESAAPMSGMVTARASLAGAHLLLVEDNEINQQVAEELLSQAGIRVSVVGDGRQGVDTLAARPDDFDGVLMDIQMPVMDGYTATRAIRDDARFRELPIIAMTANAMAGDREKALDAGMNDHVAKPIDVAELFNVLSRWIQVTGAAQPVPASTAESAGGPAPDLPDLPGLDSRQGLAHCAGNQALYRQIVQRFGQTQADAAQQVRAALEGGDTVTAERVAHTLKGLAGNIGAGQLQAQAADVETHIQQGTNAGAALAALDTTLSVLLSGLAALSVSTEPTDEGVASATPEDICPSLERLQVLLEEDDTDAVDLAAQIEAQLAQPELRSAMGGIRQASEDFAFDDALEQLLAMRDRVLRRD